MRGRRTPSRGARPKLRVALHAQQQMVDRMSRVVPVGQSAAVLYIVDAGEVRADLQFADEVGDLWRRQFGNPRSRCFRPRALW